jgi:hypothetical protein
MIAEDDWLRGGTPEQALRVVQVDWLPAESDQVGEPRVLPAETGRGAGGYGAAVQWLGESIADGVVDLAVAYALVKVIGRLRDWRDGRRREGNFAAFEISSGAAALLAAAHVAESYDEGGPLEVEAVEEPSAIAGKDITETGYVLLESRIVLLRNTARRVRYVAVVMPDGIISGALQVPFVLNEEVYLDPSYFGSPEDDPGARTEPPN